MADTDAIEIPQWMSNEFLMTCLRKYKDFRSDCELHLHDIHLSYVVPKGENYTSLMYRAKITYSSEDETLNEDFLVIKRAHDSEDMAALVENLFSRETDIYRTIGPELHQILKEKNLETTLICRYIHAVETRPRVIVMEDLRLQGYLVANRKRGLDLNHCRMVLDKIARFHAASMCYFNKQSADTRRAYSKSPFEATEGLTRDSNFDRIIRQRLADNIAELAKYGMKYKKAMDYLKGYSDACYGRVADNMPPYVEDNSLNALNHMDFWVNNVMFQYTREGALQDVILVDLQVSHYTTVAADFNYFFFSSTDMEVKKHHFDDLKHYYFKRLVEDLERLEYEGKPPTIEEFQGELKRTTNISIMILIMFLPLVLLQLDAQKASRDEAEEFSLEEVKSMMTRDGQDSFYDDILVASIGVMQDQGYFDSPI